MSICSGTVFPDCKKDFRDYLLVFKLILQVKYFVAFARSCSAVFIGLCCKQNREIGTVHFYKTVFAWKLFLVSLILYWHGTTARVGVMAKT